MDEVPVGVSPPTLRVIQAIRGADYHSGKANREFQFQKRSQLFIRVHNEPLSVVAMCVSNPDRLPVGINRCYTAPTSTRFAEIVSDYFLLLHAH